MSLPRSRIVWAIASLPFFVILGIVISQGSDSEPEPTAEPTASTAPTTAPLSTLPATDILRDLVACERLIVNLEIRWGQTPETVYMEDDSISGNLEPGDIVRILTPQPHENGAIRVQVEPHDGRAVGRTDNQVWVDWGTSASLGIEGAMFTCEG